MSNVTQKGRSAAFPKPIHPLRTETGSLQEMPENSPSRSRINLQFRQLRLFGRLHGLSESIRLHLILFHDGTAMINNRLGHISAQQVQGSHVPGVDPREQTRSGITFRGHSHAEDLTSRLPGPPLASASVQ